VSLNKLKIKYRCLVTVDNGKDAKGRAGRRACDQKYFNLAQLSTQAQYS
jgi:hypothetical protein